MLRNDTLKFEEKMQLQRIQLPKVAKASNFHKKGISDQCLEYVSFLSRLGVKDKNRASISSFLALVASYIYKITLFLT